MMSSIFFKEIESVRVSLRNRKRTCLHAVMHCLNDNAADEINFLISGFLFPFLNASIRTPVHFLVRGAF